MNKNPFFFYLCNYFIWNLHLISLIKSPRNVMIIVANNNKAIPPKTISGHDCNSSAVNKPTVDQIKAIIIKSSIGNIFCF